ncbi:hypothetical protein LAZ67_14000449 [Cordylochernes scorpioides]|uniref:Cyclic nucleotide-binding domain-containing protein n=1 Tax=Cordylochernes scorpioides TaxID=51811 RepID=A0ABY6L6H9_9ARAC|nr:hypothetical protein LAZ67_14000449 [Cordylochernes scorpioides]
MCGRKYAFTIVSYLIGVFIFATIVELDPRENEAICDTTWQPVLRGSFPTRLSCAGQVGNVITNRNASRLEFERLLDGAKLYMRHHKVPRDMQRRVQRWYDYSWSRMERKSERNLRRPTCVKLSLMYLRDQEGPTSIVVCQGPHARRRRHQLCARPAARQAQDGTGAARQPKDPQEGKSLPVNDGRSTRCWGQVTIFQECQPEFLHDLVLKMRAYIFTPGDLICRKGEVAREMFIIADGILEVISESGKVLTQMKAGDFFGEIGILNLDGFNRRTADVRSVGYSELFSLSRDDVLSAMKDYPEAQDILQTMGRKRLMEARLAASGKTAVAPTQDSSDHRPVVVKKLKGLLRGRSQAAKDDDGDSLATATSEDTAALTGNAENPAPLRKLIKKIKWKGPLEGGAQPLKGIAQKFSHFKTQLSSVDGVKNHRQESFSLESVSAAPDLPIGQGLPLLQRIKMLKELENSKKAAAAAEETKPPLTKIGEGLPLLERVKMLRAAEREKEKLAGSSKSSSKGNISSSEASPKSSDPPADDTKNQELPLLKRILLLKEKEAKETKANSGLTPHGSDAGEKESKPDKDTKSGPQKEPKPDKDTKSGPQKEPKPDKESEPQNDPDNAPESGELKEIKATETAPPPPPPPPPPPLPTRLKENNKKSPPQTSEAQVVERREDQQRLPTRAYSSRSRDQLMRQNTPEGYAARRSRFYRMLAVDDLEDDGTNNDGIQDYLAKITKNVRQAMITYMVSSGGYPAKELTASIWWLVQNENQTELKARIIRLEEELRLKDLLIRDLQNALERVGTLIRYFWKGIVTVGQQSGTPYPDREAFSPPPPAVTAEESHDSEEDDEEDDDAFSDDSQQTVMENSPAHQAACQEPRLSPPSEKIEVKPEDMWMLEFQGSRSEESLESAPPTVLVSGDPDEDDLPNNRRHSTGSKPASPPAKSPRKLLAKMGSLRKYSLMDERLLKTSASRRRKLSLQLLFGRSVRQSSECLAEDGGDPAAASPVSDPGSSSWRSEDTALPTISEHSRAAESVVISIPESQPSSGSPP